MKRTSLSADIAAGAVVALIALGFSPVSLSFAQVVTPSSTSTSTVVLGPTTSTTPTQSTPASTSSLPDSTADIPAVTSTPAAATSTATSTPTSTSDQSDASVASPAASATTALSTSSVSTSSSTGGFSAALPTSPLPPPAPTGYATCDQNVENVPGDYPTIQAAIDAAAIGDTVKIAAGTYDEDVALKSGICLEGAGIDRTVVSKTGASGITGDDVSYVIVRGLTVRNSGGSEVNGGGIALFGSSNVTVQSCRLTGSTATNGGGMFASGSVVAMDHCLIDGNTASNVGGGMVADDDSTVTITNATMANNVWSSALGNGGVGGIRSYGSNVRIANSILWGNNSQSLSGVGLSVNGSDVSGWTGGTNDISSNPDFASATDYHLQAGSPTAGMGPY